MSRSSDLAQLLALRSLREERARTAVSIATSRLEEAKRAVSEFDEALDDHDAIAREQEQRFLTSMRMQPVSETAIGRGRDLFRISDDRRDALLDRRNLARATVSEREAELAAALSQWRGRLSERDKLSEAHGRIAAVERGRAEAMLEQEAEEMGADRARLRC